MAGPLANFTLLPLLLLLCSIAGALASSPNQTTPLFPALFIFGDSIMDTGNNDVLPTIAKSNFPPYGMDFPGHVPTGRFSNGKIAADFFASKIGLKDLLPAYLGSNIPPRDILTGVSFASAGTGFDPLTAATLSVLSMQDQLDLFNEYKAKLITITSTGTATTIISKSLYIVCAGSNDVANTYFTTPYRKLTYDISSYVDWMVTLAMSFIKELYARGARTIGFVGLPPIGCLPSQRTLAGGFQRDCEPIRNQASLLYNSKIRIGIDKLKSELNGSRIIYLDLYSVAFDMIQQPSIYGFEESSKGCCGTGEFELAFLCNSRTSWTCVDDTKYVFWDSFHPTERAYEVAVDDLYTRLLRDLQ